MKEPSMAFSVSRVASSLLAGALVSACTALPRLEAVPAELTERAAIPGILDARVWLDRDLAPFIETVIQDTNREVEALRSAGKPTDQLPPAYVLAISGGGDAGAFAAGILCGWTTHRDRPEFKVVTGISVGALIAPFAFLGPRYDDVLHSLATSIGPADVLRERGTLNGLISDGMASTEPLSRLVAKYVTPDVLAAIAREFRRGRVLEIGTTNLDAGRQVIWNMGAIAASGAPNALDLFRTIIIASTIIPGAVSPVMIDVEVDGKRFQEMHVDGGVISQVFLYPASFLAELEKATGRPFQREIHSYVIRNGRLRPNWRATERHTLAVGARAISALVQMQGINDVHRLYQIALHDGVDFNLAYIGPDFEQPHPEEFDTVYMNALYEYGYGLGSTGQAWHNAPPEVTAPPGLAPRSITKEEIMSDRIQELLLRNLQEVFGEGDAARRRAAIEDLYTEDCVLYMPPGTIVGREALDKFAGDLRATHPDFSYTPHGTPQALQNAGRLAWGSGRRGEAPDYTGLDVIIVREGKIATLYAFFDSMPSQVEKRAH
jgi:predicted acylesterase/phospholipase RssA